MSKPKHHPRMSNSNLRIHSSFPPVGDINNAAMGSQSPTPTEMYNANYPINSSGAPSPMGLPYGG